MTDPNRSSRVGKKAPWPKGKPRNPVDPRWKALRSLILKALAEPSRHEPAGENIRSAAYIATLCGVGRPTVSKWIHKRANPPPEAVEAMAKWLSLLD